MRGEFVKTVSRKTINCLLVLTTLSGCGLPRHPVPTESISQARVSGMEKVRYWEIKYSPDVTIGDSNSSDCSFLALSGGGTNGAFGAGRTGNRWKGVDLDSMI